MPSFDLIEEFIFAERAAGKAQATLRNRRAALRAFSDWCDKPIETATRADLVGFLNGLLEHYARDNVNNFVSSLRRFFSWLVEEELRSDNPAARLKFVRSDPKPIEPLTPQEIEALLDWCMKRAPKLRFGQHRTYARNGPQR